jgi:hypothetical protein
MNASNDTHTHGFWRGLVMLLVVLALAIPSVADAQKRKRRKKKPKTQKTATAQVEEKGGAKYYDFTGLQLGGRLRSPQLLYFLDRAEEELDRAALEKRSFIPEMTRSMDEERL